MKVYIKFPKWYWIVVIISVLLFMLGYSVESHAEELSDFTESDSENADLVERVNSLELRVEEIGYHISEIDGTLETVQTSELSEEEERLAISEKLDLILVALNDLVNYDIETLEKLDNFETSTDTYRTELLDKMQSLNDLSMELSENTVSGNNLVSRLDDTVSKGNNDALEMNQQNDEISNTRFLAIVGVIGIAIGAVFSLTFANWFKGAGK